MTGVSFTDELPDAPPIEERPVPVKPVAAKPPAGSILGRLQAERDQLRSGTRKIMRVGRSDILAARYRALSDDEQSRIAKRIEQAQALAKRTQRNGGDDEDDRSGLEVAALTLVNACVELLWVDGVTVRPLVDVLAEDGIDTEGTEPLRYDKRSARVLGLELEPNPSTVAVAMALHQHEGGHLPLGAAFQRYSDWANGEDDTDLKDVTEGS